MFKRPAGVGFDGGPFSAAVAGVGGQLLGEPVGDLQCVEHLKEDVSLPEGGSVPRSLASSSSRRSCSCSSSRDLRIRSAVCLFELWLRSFWHWTTIPVGTWVIRTAESVLLTC